MPQTLIDNRYARRYLLGSGGMAEVYLAHDEVLDRDVALKVLRDQYAKNEEFVERFRREAKNAAVLNHPNIVPVYDWGCSEDGTYYIAMQYISGGTLKDRILAGGALDPETVIELGRQIATAVGFAHERGVIHRDIKSQNILLSASGEAKVTDFGIARAAGATTISRSSLILGTADYMSPEQAMGKPVGPRSDLYSLGVVLYEMLSGTLPYNAENPVGIALKHVTEPPRSPRETNPGVPEPLDALTLKLLAKSPEDRYASADELAKDLEQVRSGLSPRAASAEKTTTLLPLDRRERTKTMVVQPPGTSPVEVPESGGRRRGRLFRALVTLLFGVLLLGGLAWGLAQNHSVPALPGPAGTSSIVGAKASTVQVPQLYYASQAEGALTGAGLELGSRSETPSDIVPVGVVTEQNPAAGTEVEQGTAVDIVVSTGPQQAPATAQAAPIPAAANSLQAPAAQVLPTPAPPTPASPAYYKKAENKQKQAANKGKAGKNRKKK